jgi:cysteinyl-tRNA synthetase
MVRVRDTLRRDIVPLETREPGKLSMYVCGPTVYDAPHVGHGRTAVVFDVMRRYLEWTGYDVTFVSNVTDVEDKIIARAAERRTTEPELARAYEDVYFHEMERLGVRRPDHVPHATEYVARMQELVADLLERGHAYVVDGKGVYFAVETFPGYGALPHRSLDALRDSAGARVDVDDAKRSPLDFVLWKAAKADEPAWDSPWGPGRPGWHIECSAMSLDLLGDDFDLHGAGDDLVFPHNENERAQAEAAGHSFARYWVHSGMVTVGGEKMAKSLGNFTTLADALDAYGPRAFRMAVLQSHYRRPVELGAAELESAAKAVDGLDALARRASAAAVDAVGAPLDDSVVGDFRAAMDDDFNTPGAVAALSDAVRRGNRALDDGDSTIAASMLATVGELAGVLGLELSTGAGDDPEIDGLVRERDAARARRDFAAADRIRDDLAARGVHLEDTPTGTIWHR